jgi:hypothetical protein
MERKCPQYIQTQQTRKSLYTTCFPSLYHFMYTEVDS